MTEQEIKDLAKAVFDNGTKDLSAQAEKSAAAVETLKKDVNGKLDALTEKVSRLEAAPVGNPLQTKADFGTHLGPT